MRTRPIAVLGAAALLGGLLAAPAAAADPSTDGLVISEYVEGSGNNKAIEVYNGTGAPVDLSAFQVEFYFNGNTTPGTTIPLSGDLADGEVFVVADDGWVLGGDVDLLAGGSFFNGNDAVLLTSAGTTVDSLGQIGDDAVYGQDVTLSRTDLTRDTDATDAFSTAGRFDELPQDDVSGLGVAPGSGGGGGGGGGGPTPDACELGDEELTPISVVQGVGDDGSLAGTEVTVRGVVTLADADINGFFVQEEPGDADGDPATSEGLFVFENRDLPVEGQTVTLTDTVTEFNGLTQLSRPDTAVCDVPLVTIEPTELVLPLDDAGREALEGMLVVNAQDLQVGGLFTAYRFGELGLALDGPLPVPTSEFAPGTPEAQALVEANAARELKVNDRNEAFSQFSPYPWELFDEDLSAGDTMPAGRLVGALNYGFGEFKVEPLDNEVGEPGDRILFPETEDTFPRPDAPALRGGNDVASFNVLNYFNTFGDSAVLRGAQSQEEFELQTAKIVDAIIRLDASVVGLIELENDYEEFYDGDRTTVPAIVDLVDALNEVAGRRTWDYVRPSRRILTSEGLGGGGLGTDAIAQGLIYQRKEARPIGRAATFDIDAELTGDAENNRWPLAQTFRIGKERVTVVVNHFKSKGSSCDDTAGPGFDLGDDDGTTLAGNCDLTRTYAAEQLVEWVEDGATRPQVDEVLLLGDLNAYEEEAPIEVLVDAGYVDLVETLGDDAFTYKFDGRYGRLDYVFASAELVDDVVDAAVWQINSPAPVGYLYDNDPIDATAHASSDHDPVVVALATGKKGKGNGPR